MLDTSVIFLLVWVYLLCDFKGILSVGSEPGFNFFLEHVSSKKSLDKIMVIVVV